LFGNWYLELGNPLLFAICNLEICDFNYMVITLSLLLLLYLVYIAIFLFFSFFNLYHMIRFGFVSPLAYVITVGYIVLTLLALFVSYYYIAQVDWTYEIDIFEKTGFLPY